MELDITSVEIKTAAPKEREREREILLSKARYL